MSTDPTERDPIEPTMPAPHNHYDINPYASADLPSLPPPPPKQRSRDKGWIIVLLTLTLLVIVGSTLYFLMYRSVPQADIQAHAKVTPIPTHALTPTPTVTPDMTATYGATDILSDFQAQGCSCGYKPMYGTTIWQWTGDKYYVDNDASSAVNWIDPPRSISSTWVGLWVYDSIDGAQAAYDKVGYDEMNDTTTPRAFIPTEYLHGRCLLLIGGSGDGTTPWQGYAQTIQQYCI